MITAPDSSVTASVYGCVWYSNCAPARIVTRPVVRLRAPWGLPTRHSKRDAAADLRGRALADGGDDFRPIGPQRLRRPLDGTAAGVALSGANAGTIALVAAHRRQRPCRLRSSSPASIPSAEHAKALLAAFPQVLVAGRDHSAVLAGRANRVLDRQQSRSATPGPSHCPR